MLKNIFISLIFCTYLSAEKFDLFLQKAIHDSPYLNAHALDIQQEREDTSLLMRYKNPTLELEYSRFSPIAVKNDSGYRIAYMQPIRLWGVASAQEKFAKAKVKNAEASYMQRKAVFIKDLSLAYTIYCREKMFLDLSYEELLIAKKIYEISKARYENGTISKSLMMQAKASYKRVEIANETFDVSFKQSYYDLLQFAGIEEEVSLDTDYDFSLQNATSFNPTLYHLQTKRDASLFEAGIYANKIEWFNLFAEYEDKPEQTITRAGFNISLAFFNQRSQEKQIASFQAKRADFLLQKEKNFLSVEERKLDYERSSLQRLRAKNAAILKTELELLKMFEEGYKISNINLLQLQDIKNRVISTKKALIEIENALNQNAIKLNYLRGNYNE